MYSHSMQAINRIMNATGFLILLLGAVSFGGMLMHGRASDNAAIHEAGAAAPYVLAKMDGALFKDVLKDSYTRPVFLMVYASWCPHCKRMFKELNALQAEHRGKLRIIALSIDNRDAQASAFAGSISPLNLEVYRIKDGDSYREVGDDLRALGLHFEGGRSPNVGVPYNTAIYKGKAVAEVAGAIPSENIQKLVGDIAANAK